ncbi:sensor histidine kinase [Pseudosulfitobacter pseudonitzschiae]|nr:HAMP domain-containing sensor histidine kinase [Pseudosulfitobacter pseudonitzschiae]MCI2213179.1 HAMP domain-containing histidine kinase [Pseudosulfitobacter pseudonitzschiae]UFF06000.1 HAMP domain-containing histidine kinase [Pseudosulfitobacter pseudonitzschiae]UFF85222.1 HAMP domain-containing histidine kinase [Pseudosulfitobacter pseudonitzschiae]UFG04501.1 HAMP domain-containing histidine kinase [Pseudosulfitobacter pseudonitzschiae]
MAGAAIVAFGVLLVFALFRLAATETEMRKNEGDNMLWAISRTQSAALHLDASITRHAALRLSTGDIERRYNILLSRLSLLSEGPQRRYMTDLGQSKNLAMAERDIKALESEILGLSFGDTAAVNRIHDVLGPLIEELGRAGNRSMVRQWEATGARLDQQRQSILQVIVSILAIIALGIFLSVSMLRAMAGHQRSLRSFKREQEVAEAYRSFVALVSHQFRTPLAVIDSAMQRLLRSGRNMERAEIERRAEQVRTEVAGLTKLIGATLDVVRLEAGQVMPSPETCYVETLVERARTRQIAETPDRVIEVQIASEVPPSIETDPLLTEQILNNLVSNAVKYSPETEPVKIRVSTLNKQVCFAVEDGGVGIPDIEQAKLFDRFFRASTSAGVPGTGVGLSIASQLARLLGGQLDFVSRAGIGSTFTLRLPIASASPQVRSRVQNAET